MKIPTMVLIVAKESYNKIAAEVLLKTIKFLKLKMSFITKFINNIF